MEIEREHAEKPIRKLRKALKRLPAEPSVDEVHALRTQSRRLEAIVNALMLDEKKKTRRLLKAMTPVRKAAGEVRDMDVLVGNVLTLSDSHRDEALVRLIEHLGERRVEGARELRQTIEQHKKDARRNLKQYVKLVGKQFPDDKQAITGATQASVELTKELVKWPKLDAENIHPFRIKVKQLRYMLQLSKEADKKVVDTLGKVKDEVGDWHDWQELAGIARQVLSARQDGAALKRIEEIGEKKFKHALAAANSLRTEYFSDGWGGGTKGGSKKRAKK